MVLDPDSAPRLAYYSRTGAVSQAEQGDGDWDVTDVADAGAAPETGAAAIVVDSQGVQHVAWQNDDGTIGYANDEQGDFGEPEAVPRSEGGANPVLGVDAEDEAWLGWFDTDDTEVQLALRSEAAPLLALPSPTAAATGGTTGGPAACQPDGTEISVTAPPGAAGTGFDTDCLAVPAGKAFSIDFDNQDEGQSHKVGIYTSEGGDEIFMGDIITGPDQATYEVDAIAEKGNFYFQCDVHPSTMNGTFVVAKGK